MAILAAVLVCACACVCLTKAQNLDLTQGDICKQSRGVKWTCKVFKNCPKAQEDFFVRKKRPQYCNLRGTGKESLICCEPGQAKLPVPPTPPPRPVGDKSKQMCKQYAKLVFIQLPAPFGDSYQEYDTCSIVEPLITDGKNASSAEFPHMALIGYGNKGSVDWLCGGSLISERFVMSAAHCSISTKKGKARWARLGEYNVQTDRDDEQGLSQAADYEIIQIIDHPGYKSPSVYNDITLYKLGTKVEFNEYVRPICLHTEYQIRKPHATATGWGRTEWGGKKSILLQKVNLSFFSRRQCVEEYRDANKEKLQYGVLDESMMCAGDVHNKKDTCHGDSGGPLQIRLKDPYCMYSQVAITSFGAKCQGGKPGVYTRVSHFVPWIESIVWP